MGNVKKLVSNIFDKEKNALQNLQLYLRLGLKLKDASLIRLQSVTMAKTIC